MEDFELKRQEYLKRLKENQKLVNSVINNPQNSKKTLAIFLAPKSEIELKIANCLLDFFIDTIFIIEHSYINDIDVDYDNNSCIERMVSIINALKCNNIELANEINNKYCDEKDPKIVAKLIYDIYKVFSCDPERAIEIIAEKTGFDTSDYDSRQEFEFYFSQSQAIVNSVPQLSIDNIDDLENNELLRITLYVMQEFHLLCERDKELRLSSK